MHTEFLSNAYIAAFEAMGIPSQPLFRSKLIDTQIPHPLFNGVTHLDMRDPHLSRLAKYLRNYFNGLPHSLWVAGKPSFQFTDLQSIGTCPAMVLTTLPTHSPSHTIHPLIDSSCFSQWIETLAEIFQFEKGISVGLTSLLLKAGLQGPLHHFYCVDGPSIVATGSLLCTPLGAYLLNIGTLESHRHRGYATALTVAMTHFAFERGAARIGLISSPNAGPFYESLGFETNFSYHVFVS